MVLYCMVWYEKFHGGDGGRGDIAIVQCVNFINFLLGKKIAHVWEKVESMIISVRYLLVPVRR